MEILIIGQGCLFFHYKTYELHDGIIWYKTISLSLLFRLIFGKKTKRWCNGKFLAIGNIIIWFKKEPYCFQHTSIYGETYTRKNIKRRTYVR